MCDNCNCGCNDRLNETIISKTYLVPGEGKDGLTPYRGVNGNWWIGNTDTGEPVTGDTYIPVLATNIFE